MDKILLMGSHVFKRIFGLFIFCVGLWASVASAQTYVIPPPKSELPIIVKVGLTINDITSVNEENETITFEGLLMVHWHDKRLAFNPASTGTNVKIFTGEDAHAEVNKIWQPEVRLVEMRGKPQTYAEFLTITSKGEVRHTMRIYATVENRLDFHHFPFEIQMKNFELQSLLYDASHVKIIQMPRMQGYVNPDHLEGWQILSSNIRTTTVENKIFKEPFSRYLLEIVYERSSFFYVMQVIVPLVLIVLFSFSIFWMLHNPVVNRTAISLTALLTIVVFEWRIFSLLPHINYLTFLDVLLLFSFIIVAAAMFPSIAYDHLPTEKAKDRLQIWCRIGFPSAYFFGSLLITWYFFG